jgi:hypothetical protein
MTYSKYTDPEKYPRFGGDDRDPPAYVMDLRSRGIGATIPGVAYLWPEC